jgi:hypothetical protein
MQDRSHEPTRKIVDSYFRRQTVRRAAERRHTPPQFLEVRQAEAQQSHFLRTAAWAATLDGRWLPGQTQSHHRVPFAQLHERRPNPSDREKGHQGILALPLLSPSSPARFSSSCFAAEHSSNLTHYSIKQDDWLAGGAVKHALDFDANRRIRDTTRDFSPLPVELVLGSGHAPNLPCQVAFGKRIQFGGRAASDELGPRSHAFLTVTTIQAGLEIFPTNPKASSKWGPIGDRFHTRKPRYFVAEIDDLN